MAGPADTEGDPFEAEARALAGVFVATRRADLDGLERDLRAADFDAIRRVGHVFRGSGATFGFPEAGRLGALLEERAALGDLAGCRELLGPLRESLDLERD